MPKSELATSRKEVEQRLARGVRSPVVPQLRQLVDAAGSKAEVDLLRWFGICLEDGGEIEEAADQYRAVLAKAPDDAAAQAGVARCESLRVPAPTPHRKAVPGAAKRTPAPRRVLPSHEEAKAQFLRHFPDAFRDAGYLEHERDYKWEAHGRWVVELSQPAYQGLLASGDVKEICRRLRQAIRGLNLMSRFESAALIDVTESPDGASLLARGIYDLVYGGGDADQAFDALVLGLQRLNQPGTAPWKWPIVTVFPFVADPEHHIFVKPAVTKRAASRFHFTLDYRSIPNAASYRSVRQFAQLLAADLKDWQPRDNIDIQSFNWVTNSEGYA